MRDQPEDGSFWSKAFDGQNRLCSFRACRGCPRKFIAPVRRRQDYCSVACKAKSTRTRTARTCPVCGAEFFIRTSHLKKIAGPPCCSRECRSKAQKVDSGVDVFRPRQFGKAKGRSSVVLKKMISRCASCGISFKPALVIHHMDGNEENNDRSNLECLCWLHHAARHMVFSGGCWRYSSMALTPRDRKWSA